MKTVLIVACMVGHCFAGVYNVKILNDNQPDFSDATSFMNSIVNEQGATSDHARAISLWKWCNNARVQTALAYNEYKSGPIKDAITMFHNSGNNLCSCISAMMYSLFEAHYLPLNVGYPYQAPKYYVRQNGLNAHVTADFHYDNAWHMFDPSMSHYVLKSTNVVASADDLESGGASIFNSGCPQITSKNGNMYTADYSTRTVSAMAGCYNGFFVLKQNYEGSAICQQYLSVRPYEYYKKYKKVLGTSSDYYITIMDGNHPNQQLSSGSSICNGEWVIDPDLSQNDWEESTLYTSNISKGTGPQIHPATAGQDAEIVFNVNCYNWAISGDLTASVIKGGSDQAEAYISNNAGKTWISLGQIGSGSYSKHLTSEVRNKRCFLLKVRLRAASNPASVGLNALKLRLITQINRKAFFFLDRGNNKVTIKLDPVKLDRIELRPNMDPSEFRKYSYADSNFGATHDYCNVIPNETGPGHVVFKLDAPGEIKRVKMGGNFWRRNRYEDIKFLYSIDNGATWTNYGGKAITGTGDYNGTLGYQGDHVADTTIEASGVLSVLLKCQIIKRTASSSNGILDLWCAADYSPPNSPFRPLEVTLNWTEYRNSGPVTRSHVKRITSFKEITTYDVNVGGYRFPRMNYYTVNVVGSNPDAPSGEGYSDGQDVGNTDYPKVHYTKMNLQSQGASVSSSPSPNSGSNSNLTDENVPFGQHPFVSPTSTSCGIWNAGSNPDITINLGSSKTIGGITVFQGAPTGSYQYADAIQVSTSPDNSNWTDQGTIQKDDLWDWPGDYVPPQTWENQDYLNQYQWNLGSYDFPLSFSSSTSAQYVKLKMTNSGKTIIYEVRVWGTMGKADWPYDVFDHTGGGVGTIEDWSPTSLKLRRNANGMLVSAFPNPFRSSVVIRALGGGKIRSLKIYDVKGRMVYNSHRLPVSRHQQEESMTWNGVDSYGRKVVNGSYYIRMVTDLGEALPRVNLVR